MKSLTPLAAVVFAASTQVAFAQNAQCPTERNIVYIQKGVNDTPSAVIAAAAIPNSEVLLAPNVDIDFSGVEIPQGSEGPLIVLARCVTLASYQPQSVVALNAHGVKRNGSSRCEGVTRTRGDTHRDNRLGLYTGTRIGPHAQ